MTEIVALIGAGAMGGAIGARLVQTGTPLVVFDLDAEKVAALVALGATAAPSAAAAAFKPSTKDWVRALRPSKKPGLRISRSVAKPQAVATGLPLKVPAW